MWQVSFVGKKHYFCFNFVWFILSVRPTIGIQKCRFHCVFFPQILRIQCASPCLAVYKPRSSYLVDFGKLKLSTLSLILNGLHVERNKSTVLLTYKTVIFMLF